MTDNQLHVAFVWHMHQPYYKDPLRGVYTLPWVRLHGVKDYLDMAEILREFPSIRQTFNLVPSLLEQLSDYMENNPRDIFLDAAMKPSYSLTDQDRAFMLENFFFANWETMIRPIPRYYELLKRRGLRFSRSELKSTMRYFKDNDFLDLQVLFNLSWIDPSLRQKDKDLTGLLKKGGNYTEEEKGLVLKKQVEIIKKIVPTYRELASSGQIELSTSAFYHPILPLIINTDEAKIATPDIRLPKTRFSHPEDAQRQIRMALDYFEKTFGKRPEGMWPPEGSVSEAVLKAMRDEGIRWVATDEEVLGASTGKTLRNHSGHITEPQALYRPYRFADVHILFRDHGLSDLIGFTYAGWPPQDAAYDLINNLLNIRRSLPKDSKYIVPIILDGENAWEYYKNDGYDFLLYLYEGLSKEERLKTVTISDYLAEYADAEPLGRLHSGSWIYANFRTWIGHEEDNLAWDYLKEARDALTGHERLNPQSPLEEAWQAIYVAEGSDWNWWYGDEHMSETQKEFDELYRANLLKVYRAIGKEPPQYLSIPILKADRAVAPKTAIRGFISPKIDGIVTSYFEWYQSALLDVGKSGGSMHRAESLLREIHYGFNLNNLFLRVDPKIPFSDFPEGATVSIYFLRPYEFKVNITLAAEVKAGLFKRQDAQWHKIKDIAEAAVADILEVAISFIDINVAEAEELHLCISVNTDSGEIERCPWQGYISLVAPTPDFEAMMWY